MLDDDNLSAAAMPVLGGLPVGPARFNQRLHQVKLFPGTHDNVRVPGHHGVVNGYFIHVLPAIAAVVHIEDDLRMISFRQHHGLQGRLSTGRGRQRSSGDQQSLGIFDVLFVDIVGVELQIRNAVNSRHSLP